MTSQMVLITAQRTVCVGVCNLNSLISEELRNLLCMELLLVKSAFVRQIIYYNTINTRFNSRGFTVARGAPAMMSMNSGLMAK